MNKITNKYVKQGNLHRNCSITMQDAILQSIFSVKYLKKYVDMNFIKALFMLIYKNIGSNPSAFEHILRIVTAYCLLIN